MSEQSIEQNVFGKIACYGKIRSKGDFVSRNLDYQVQDYLDQWLQSSFKISQEQIGDDWLKCYLTSPIWRFVISDLAMNKDIVGLMMPSIDKVGRYYPLFLLEVFDDGALCGNELNSKSFEELEELAMGTLDAGEEGHKFFEALNQSGFPLLSELPPVSELLRRLSLKQGVIKQDVAEYLWQDDGQYLLFEHENRTDDTLRGVWWTEGSEAIQKSLIYCQAFPPVEGFSAMLDGDWQRWGWQEKIIKEEDEAFAAE